MDMYNMYACVRFGQCPMYCQKKWFIVSRLDVDTIIQ